MKDYIKLPATQCNTPKEQDPSSQIDGYILSCIQNLWTVHQITNLSKSYTSATCLDTSQSFRAYWRKSLVFHDFSRLSEFFYCPFTKVYLSLQPSSALNNCSVQCSCLCPLSTRCRWHTEIII